MANKIVSLLLQVKNAISPGADEASESLRELEGRSRSLERELAKFQGAQNALSSLDDAAQSALDAEAAFDKAQSEVIRLKAALKADRTPELALALDKAKIAAGEAKKEWAATKKTVSSLEGSLKRAGISVDDLSGAEKQLADELERVNGKLSAHGERLDRHRKKYGDVAKAAEDSGSRIGAWTAGVVGAVAGLAIVDKIKDGFFALTAAVFETGSEFEQLSKRLSPRELGYVEEFARNTPLALNEVAESFAKLRTFGIEPTNGALQAAVDYNAKLGGSAESLDGIITALGQAWSKQKLQQEEVLQLVERGVPAWDLLAEATGKSVPELQDLASAGALGRREIELLLDAMGQAAAGQAASAMDSLQGIVSNLGDEVTSFYRRVADNGAMDSLKDALKGVQAEITAMAGDGRLDAVARAMSDFFVGVINGAKTAAGLVGDYFGVLYGSAQIVISQMQAGFHAFSTGVFATLTLVNRALGELADAAGFDEFAERSRLAAEKYSKKWSESSDSVVASLDGTVKGFGNLNKSFDEIYDSTEAVGEASVKAGKQSEAMAHAAAIAAKNLAAEQGKAGEAAADLYGQLDDLGLGYEQVFGGVSAGAQKAMDAVDGIAQRIAATGDVTVQEAQGMELALANAIPKLDTLEAIERFEDKIRALGETGFLSADGLSRVTAQLEDQRATINQSIPGLQNLEDAYRSLGLISRESLRQQAADAKAAFEQIRNGTGDLDEIKRAFVAYAEKAIEANDGVADAAIRAGAEIYGVSGEIDGLGVASDVTAGRVDRMGRALDQAGGRALDAAQDIQAATGQTETYTERLEGFASQVGDYYSNLRNTLRDLVGDEAVAEFDRKMSKGTAASNDMTAGLDELGVAAARAREQMSGLRSNVAALTDFTGFSSWAADAQLAFNEVVIAADESRRSSDDAADAVESVGDAVEDAGIRMAAMPGPAGDAADSLVVMGSAAKTAGDNAELAAEQMEALADRAKSSLDSIRNELWRLQGDQAAINQSSYESRKSDLELDLAEAQASGNDQAVASLQEALALLEQVRAIQQSNEEITQRRADAQRKRDDALERLAEQRKYVERDNSGPILEYRLGELDKQVAEAERKYEYTMGVLDDLEEKREREQQAVGSAPAARADAGQANRQSDPEPGDYRTIMPIETIRIELGDRFIDVPADQRADALAIIAEAAGRSV